MGCKIISVEKSSSALNVKIVVGQKGDINNATDSCGDKNGTADSSLANNVTGMVQLNKDSFIYADKGNHRIKGVNFKQFFTGTPDFVAYQNDVFTVYPNPAVNVVNIKMAETSKNAMVKIFNMNGKVLYNNTITGLNNQIDVSMLPNGVYNLTVGSAQSTMTSKLIIKK
jgi:hypothetical protein